MLWDDGQLPVRCRKVTGLCEKSEAVTKAGEETYPIQNYNANICMGRRYMGIKTASKQIWSWLTFPEVAYLVERIGFTEFQNDGTRRIFDFCENKNYA